MQKTFWRLADWTTSPVASSPWWAVVLIVSFGAALHLAGEAARNVFGLVLMLMLLAGLPLYAASSTRRFWRAGRLGTALFFLVAFVGLGAYLLIELSRILGGTTAG